MEKLFFGSVLGIGKKSKASTREKHNNDDAKKDIRNGDNVNNNNDDMEKDNESGDNLAKIKEDVKRNSAEITSEKTRGES